MGADVPPGEIGRLAWKRGRPVRTASGPPWRDLAEAVLTAAVLALFVRTFLIQAWAVPSSSMEDTILAGDHLFVNKFVFGPRAIAALDGLLPRRPIARGDIVVFRAPFSPRRDFLKRVAGLPGDTIEIAEGTLRIDGVEVPTPPDGRRADEPCGPTRVPAGAWFALGDHRADSNDSRSWGMVPLEAVEGRALIVYWSFDENRRNGPIGWLRATRWKRLLTPAR